MTSSPAPNPRFALRLGTVVIAVVMAMTIPASVTADETLLIEHQSGFSTPILLTAPTDDDRLFIVEKGGRIEIVAYGSVLPVPFLDLSASVSNGSEQGLLGLAFHPDYAVNGKFYVSYTDLAGDSRVVEYKVSSDPNVADASTAKVVLTVDQPATNHNGGMIAFGPDRLLYVGLGDGGGGGDPFGNGQRTDTLLGAILRINIDTTGPYVIPADNPFSNEVWAYGLRNPWRFSFDSATGDLYIGDVGQNAWEEITTSAAGVAGVNHGWNVMEGNHCYSPSVGCSTAGLNLPAAEYGHGEGCSVTGGYVYRGSEVAALDGTYFYSDFCSGWIRSFVGLAGGGAKDWTAEFGIVGNVTSFGTDGHDELYVLTSAGAIHRLSAGVDRIAGSTRYGTAAEISAAAFPAGASDVYIATGENHPDALAAASVATASNSPILLVASSGIPTETAAELSRLDPDRIVILGGTGAVSAATEAALDDYAPVVTRLAGADRYGTAAAVSAAMFPANTPLVYVATGSDFPDALTAGPVAAANDAPVLLVAADSVPTATAAELDRLNPTSIVVLGGSGVVTDDVVEILEEGWAPVTRLFGADRYATAAAISASEFSPGIATVYIGTGADFPDALAAAPLTMAAGPVLLVQPDSIPAATATELARLGPTEIVLLGGSGAVTERVQAQLWSYQTG
ncbi:MAG: hypothetical protein HKN07_10490 [Acidimicrobiia bacterium]|nr:cell wall-binding repeat-containing protein [Acidimicrobiia bacterium]NNF64674.1 hypothetical protein [Acidimicrobiia bacterium]